MKKLYNKPDFFLYEEFVDVLMSSPSQENNTTMDGIITNGESNPWGN